MSKQDSSMKDKDIYTIYLTFKNANENSFTDFYSIANKIQENKLFLGKKHYEKVMIISYTDQFNDLQDKYEITKNIQVSINKQLEKLMEANDYNVQLGQMKKVTKIEVLQKKNDDSRVDIYMLLQYSKNKCDQNILQEIKRMLKADICQVKTFSRSSIYKNFYRPHTDIFQYPTQNRLVLNNFLYGMQKNPQSEFITIWDLKDLTDLYENEKEGCQGVCFVEFIHKKNFKDENKFFIYFTVKVLNYYIPFQIEVQVESIYTRELFQKQGDGFILFLKIAGFPKISKSLEVNNRFYYHYDFLNWQRYPENFLLGKIQKQSNLIKMQILQHHVIQININREQIKENKEAFENIISYFKEQNKILFHQQLPQRSQPDGLQYKKYLINVLEFLEDIKSKQKQYKQYFHMFQYSLANLVMNKIIDLQMLEDKKTTQTILENFKKTTLLFRLMHLNPSIFQIQNGDLNTFLESQVSLFNNLKELKNKIKKYLWIPENFCLVNKIIITPSVIIYGNEELVPLSSNFKIKKFYEKNSIIYLLDEDLNLFDFEETSEAFFNSIFEKCIQNNTVKIYDFMKYDIEAITSRCMKRNCFFATQSEKDENNESQLKIEQTEETFLDFIQKSNVNYTQPIYTCEIDKIEIQGQHKDIGYLNFKLLDKILSDAEYDNKDMQFSSIFLNYKLNDGTNNLCTLFYHEGMNNKEFQIKFTFTFNDHDEKNKNFEKVTIQIFRINKCREKGFINKTNLGDFLKSKNLIVKKLDEPIQQDKFEGLELSLQLNEVKIWQKINQLESYLCQNIYPIQDSFIVTGRKAISINNKVENIYDRTQSELTKNFDIQQIQLKLPQHRNDIKKVLVAKKRGTFVGKFYVFKVLEGGVIYQSNELKINQSIILFHEDFQEYYFWPELYSSREDAFENNQREYIIIVNQNVITNEMEQFTIQKIEDIKGKIVKDNNDSINDKVMNEQNINKEKIETRGQQFLKGLIKNNIKSQAMLLFYGEQEQQQNDDTNKQDQYQESKVKSESYLNEMFNTLNLNQPPFNLDKFKIEKKNYDFYFLLKSSLNHIVYSLNLEFKIKNQNQKEKHENLEKNNKTLILISELYDDIQKQLSQLKNQIKTSPNSFFQFHQYRNVFVEREESLPQELLNKCIKNMMIFYQNLDQLSQKYIQKRTDINQKNNLFYDDHKMQNSKVLSSGYYLDLHELIKAYKKNQIKDIAQDFVDYFNTYFKEELQQDRQMYLYHEAMKPIIYIKNQVKYLRDVQNKMKEKVILLLKEAMYVVNFYFITKNKKLDQHDLSQFEDDLKELYKLAKDSLQNQIFYYYVLPKIIKSLGYNPRISQYFVMKNIKNQIQKDLEQEEEQNFYFDLNVSVITKQQFDLNASETSILDLSIMKNIK
ncbi:hypothetical protein ABPG72_009507 [Tetrahymena utriculariae]